MGTLESKEKLDPTGENMSDWFCRYFLLLMKQLSAADMQYVIIIGFIHETQAERISVKNVSALPLSYWTEHNNLQQMDL